MKSHISCFSIVAIMCISTVALCEIQHDTWWDGAGGTGYYSSSEASALASGGTSYQEHCATGSHDIITTVSGYFDFYYSIDAEAYAAYITNDIYGGQSYAYGSGYGEVTGGPFGYVNISASASITGQLNPDFDYDYDDPSSQYDEKTDYSTCAYSGLSAWHTVYAWAEIWTGSDNESTAYGSASAYIGMSES